MATLVVVNQFSTSHKMSTARSLDFMCPCTNSSTALFFYCSYVLKGSQFLFQAAVTLVSQSIRFLEEGILYLITATLLWNTICFQKSKEVKDKNKWQLL